MLSDHFQSDNYIYYLQKKNAQTQSQIIINIQIYKKKYISLFKCYTTFCSIEYVQLIKQKINKQSYIGLINMKNKINIKKIMPKTTKNQNSTDQNKIIKMFSRGTTKDNANFSPIKNEEIIINNQFKDAYKQVIKQITNSLQIHPQSLIKQQNYSDNIQLQKLQRQSFNSSAINTNYSPKGHHHKNNRLSTILKLKLQSFIKKSGSNGLQKEKQRKRQLNSHSVDLTQLNSIDYSKIKHKWQKFMNNRSFNIEMPYIKKYNINATYSSYFQPKLQCKKGSNNKSRLKTDTYYLTKRKSSYSDGMPISLQSKQIQKLNYSNPTNDHIKDKQSRSTQRAQVLRFAQSFTNSKIRQNFDPWNYQKLASGKNIYDSQYANN